MADPRRLLLFVFLAACGGVAGEDLFADSPITPPGICPIGEDQDQGACDEQPGPLHLAPAVAPYAAPAGSAPNTAADDAPEPVVDVDAGVSFLPSLRAVHRG